MGGGVLYHALAEQLDQVVDQAGGHQAVQVEVR